MKALLIIIAIVEVGAGVTLLVAPSMLARLLLGVALDAPVATTVARIAGAALLALTIACWAAREDGQSRSARGIVAAMLVYNLVATALLVHAGTSGLQGIGLWPTAAVHAILGVWCLAVVARHWNRRSNPRATIRE